MLDVLNDMSVPDVRAVVTVPRLQMLKRQTQSLTLHQKKLDAELTLLADRFQSKRRCIDEQRARYAQTLEQVCAACAPALFACS
jgi:SWI/SNF-related matrix-associated actin-dependent regulator of chromatin subfamily E protein 1